MPAVVLMTLALAAPGHSDPGDPTNPPTIKGGATKGGFFAKGAKDPKPAPKSNGQVRNQPHDQPQIVEETATCVDPSRETTFSGVGYSVTFCPPPEPAKDQVTVSDVRRAFAELKLPAGKLIIQPPDGLTLVNFDSNFYTTNTEPITKNVTLLGQAVTIEATPDTYNWTFGDGKTANTTDPGAAYPDLRVTHNYLRKGTYRPSLATTYTGRFKIGSGPWLQIPGTVTIDGTPQTLRAIEATPKLVGY